MRFRQWLRAASYGLVFLSAVYFVRDFDLSSISFAQASAQISRATAEPSDKKDTRDTDRDTGTIQHMTSSFDSAESIEGSESLNATSTPDPNGPEFWNFVAVEGGFTFEAPNGSRPIPLVFSNGARFFEDRAVVAIDGKFGVIDPKGNFIVRPEFDYAFSYREGSTIVEFRGRYLMIDRNGRQLSDTTYDQAWPINGIGGALVKIGDRFAYLNERGDYLFPPEIEETFGFDNGLAAVKINGVFQYIDQTGQIAIQGDFDYAWPFNDQGEALVSKNDRNWIIDRTGKVLRQH